MHGQNGTDQVVVHRQARQVTIEDMVYVHRHGHGTNGNYSHRARDERIGAEEHVVAWADSCGAERQADRCRPVHHRDRGLLAEIARELLL